MTPWGESNTRPVPVCGLVLTALLASGCDLLSSRQRSYLSNGEILESVAEDSGFSVDPRLYELFQAEVREDALLLYYRGVTYPGDQAWIWRFSRKSSEQKPDVLTDLDQLIPIIEEGRDGFRAGEPRTRTIGPAALTYLPYTFRPPIRDPDGEPHQGHGILGILERRVRGEPVVFYFNLDNWGDRSEFDESALEPFLKAMVE